MKKITTLKIIKSYALASKSYACVYLSPKRVTKGTAEKVHFIANNCKNAVKHVISHYPLSIEVMPIKNENDIHPT